MAGDVIAMGAGFRVAERAPDEDARVFAITGEVDLLAAPELKQRIARAIEGGARRVVIDLTGASLLDSTALGVLVGAMRRLRLRDGDLAVASRDPAILRLLAITGLDDLIPVAGTPDEALAALAAGR